MAIHLEEGYIRLSTEPDTAQVGQMIGGVPMQKMAIGHKAWLKAKAYEQYKLHMDNHTDQSALNHKPNNENRTTMKSLDTRNVFVVHGRNAEARKALFAFLRSIGLRPLEWSQAIKETGKASPYIGEVLDAAFSKAQAVVVLATPDDEAWLREPFRSQHDPAYESQLTGQARPNVLFEAGMAMGRNPDRTILVELGKLRPFSDIGGRHAVRMGNDSTSRHELAQRLQTAGCAVDLTGSDWHTEGNFALEALNLTASEASQPTANQTAEQDKQLLAELNEIRQRNESLENEVTRLRKAQVTEIPNLASLDDPVKVTGTYSTRTVSNVGWSIETTWGKLFALLAPHLVINPSDLFVKNKLGYLLYAKGDLSSDHNITLNELIYQTIKIQFQALNLINVQRVKYSNGLSEIEWSLTEKGFTQMLSLGSIKAEQSDS